MRIKLRNFLISLVVIAITVWVFLYLWSENVWTDQLENATFINNCLDTYHFHIVNQYGNAKVKSHPIEFLPQLRNPCWWERFNSADIDKINSNPYIELKNRTRVPRILQESVAILKKRLESASMNRDIRLRCLPYFNIIGQLKCGTTDLFYRLARHPQIEICATKEPYWWSHHPYIPFCSYVDLNSLVALKIENQLKFNHCNKTKDDVAIIGEGSVAMFSEKLSSKKSYIYGQKPPSDTPSFLKWVLPEIKLIIMLRNPISRLLSDYLYYGSTGSLSQSDFHNRVLHTLELWKNCSQWYGDDYCVKSEDIHEKSTVNMTRGLYVMFLKEWLKNFHKRSFFIIKTENYAADKATVLQSVYKFLELDSPTKEQDASILVNGIANKGRHNIGDMWPSTRQVLYDYYQPYNVQLAALLNDERFLWQ